MPGYDEDDLGELNEGFLRFIRSIRNYLRIDAGWPAEEIDQFLEEPLKYKRYWIDRYSPERVVREECPGMHGVMMLQPTRRRRR